MVRSPIANPAVTFSPEQLAQVIQAAIAEHEANKSNKAKAEGSNEMERLAVKAFKRKGYTDTQPRVNILTYGKWVEKGFKAKEGEKAVAVKGLRLFHADQVEPISKKEQAEYLAKRAAKANGKAAPTPAPKTAKKAEVVPISEAAQVH